MFSKLPVKEQRAIFETHSGLLAEELKRLRLEAGVSRNELSQISGVSRHTITEVEEGNSQPTTGTLMRITYALNLSCAELFELVEPHLETATVREEEQANGYLLNSLDEDLEKAFFKLRRKSQSNPDLRSTVLDLAKLQTVYNKNAV